MSAFCGAALVLCVLASQVDDVLTYISSVLSTLSLPVSIGGYLTQQILQIYLVHIEQQFVVICCLICLCGWSCCLSIIEKIPLIFALPYTEISHRVVQIHFS